MTAEKSSCELVNTLSITESVNFSYDAFDNETRFLIKQRTNEIKNLIHRSAQDIFDIGQKLLEVKDKLGHGKFLSWLRTEFGWSESAARKFMQVAREFKMVNFTDLNIASSALYLLASNSTASAARREALERASSGDIINYSKAKSIIEKHKIIDNCDLPTEITVDVSAEIVDEGATSLSEPKLKYIETEETSFKQLEQRAKYLGLLHQNTDERSPVSLHPLPVEAVKICTKFIDTVEDMNFQLLESMEDEALKVLINKSKLLARRAKMLLNQRWQITKKN